MRVLIFTVLIGPPVLTMVLGGVAGWLVGHDMGIAEGYQLGYQRAQELLNW